MGRVQSWQMSLGHGQFHNGRIKGNDPEIDTAQNHRQSPKRLDWPLALLEKI